MNPQMFNSFLDGTKSALEMAAVANACGLKVPQDGLSFPPCGVDHLAEVLKGRDNGGQLAEDGMVEVVSSLERDGRPVFRDLRWGVYVVFKAPNDYAAACFKQYGMTHRQKRPLRRALPALSPDRPGAFDLRPQCRAQPPADRSDPAHGAATWRRSPSAPSRPARRSTGRAASPSTAS